MIGKLSGVIDEIIENYILLDVQGVGYQIFCSPRTLSRIGQKGDPASLLIDTNVREDAITLFGFPDKAEQQWFRLLTSVQGVGAKAAMAILGVTPSDQLGFAIASGDKAALTRADGVGPKIAMRILTELKDKAGKIDLQSVPQTQTAQANDIPTNNSIDQDAVSALVNLGYGRSDAFAAVSQAKTKSNDNENLQDIIRLALKELSQ